jgi:hypothetical protein
LFAAGGAAGLVTAGAGLVVVAAAGLTVSVTITWVPTQLYTLTVSVASGDGNDVIISSPAGIDCGPGVTDSVCSAPFPVGYTVTLTTESPGDIDIVDGWSGGGCPAQVNITNPYTRSGQPGLAATVNNTCAVTMTADTNVSASFAGVMLVEDAGGGDVNFVPDPGGAECPTDAPNCKGTLLQGAVNLYDVIPYGTAVHVIEEGTSATFSGLACNTATGATITATECDFTMAPGDAGGIDLPGVLISG